MKKILVPTDFSDYSENALRYAVELAKKEKGKLILLHVYPDTFTAPDLGGTVVTDRRLELEKETRAGLQRKCEEVEKEGLACDFLCRHGVVTDAIATAVSQTKADLLVMGMKGKGKSGTVAGSTALGLLEGSGCPLIVVPQEASYQGIRRITFATDYRSSDLDAIRRMTEIAKTFGAHLDLLHVTDGEMMEDAEKELLADFMEEVSDEVSYPDISYRLIHGKDVEKRLEQYAEDTEPDLLALSMQQRSPLEKLFGKSITKKMARHTHIPLLVFHYKQEHVVLI